MAGCARKSAAGTTKTSGKQRAQTERHERVERVQGKKAEKKSASGHTCRPTLYQLCRCIVVRVFCDNFASIFWKLCV